MGDVPELDELAIVVGLCGMDAISTLSDPHTKPQDCPQDETTIENIEAVFAYLAEKREIGDVID